MMANALLRTSLTSLPFALLMACSTVPAAGDLVLAAPEDAEQANSSDGSLTVDGEEAISLLVESEYVANPLPEEIPANFTGCYEDALACFVSGDQVDVAVRYEPQSGRFWFLDPSSGDTFYADGSVRTTNSFKPQVAALEPEAEPVEAVLVADGDSSEPTDDAPVTMDDSASDEI